MELRICETPFLSSNLQLDAANQSVLSVRWVARWDFCAKVASRMHRRLP